MRIAVALLLVLCLPAVSACSLAYHPFDQPTHDQVLRYVDGSRVVEVQQQRERTLAEGFFLTYAPVEGGIVVAGQDGLGADCSGEPWLALWKDGQEVWRRDTEAHVWPHPEGPFVRSDGMYHRLEGEELVPMQTDVPADAHVLAWGPGAEPIYRMDRSDQVVVGDVVLDVDPGSWPAAASHQGAVAVLDAGERTAKLHIVAPDGVQLVAWGLPGFYHDPAVTWAGAWYAVAGGGAYRIDQGEVVSLGLEAVDVGVRGGQALVFTEQGYHVFEGPQPVEAWRRVEGVWLPAAPDSRPQPVPATSTTTTAGPGTGGTSGAPQDTDVPGAATLLPVALCLVAVAVRRRHRRA